MTCVTIETLAVIFAFELTIRGGDGLLFYR